MDDETQVLLSQIADLQAELDAYRVLEIVDCEELSCVPDGNGTLECDGALCLRTTLPEPALASMLFVGILLLMLFGRLRRS